MESNTAPNVVRISKVDMMSTKDLDMKLRRVINASDAVNSNDYTTLEQVQSLIDNVNASITSLQSYVNQQLNKTNSNLNATPLVLGASGGAIAFFTNNTSLAVVKQVLASYTSNSQGSAYIGINNAATGSPYAQVADLNNLRLAYQNLMTMCNDLRTKIQTSTLVG